MAGLDDLSLDQLQQMRTSLLQQSPSSTGTAPSATDIQALAASRPQAYQPSPSDASAMSADLAAIQAKNGAGASEPPAQLPPVALAPGQSLDDLSLEDLNRLHAQTLAVRKPEVPSSPIVGTTAEGIPIFSDPSDNEAMTKSVGDTNARMSEKGLEGFTAGLAPYPEAAVRSLGGGTFGQNLLKARQYTADTSAQYPMASTAAEIAGTIPLTLATAGLLNPAETLAGRMAQGAGVGAGVGGVTAAGHDIGSGNTGNVVGDTAGGAVAGGVLGGAVPAAASKIVAPIWNWAARMSSPQSAASNQAIVRLAQRVSQDASGGGPTAQDILDAVNAAPAGEGNVIADFGGNNVLGEAGRVLRQPGPGKQLGIELLANRAKAEPETVANLVQSGISNGGPAYSASQALLDARAAAGAPAYEKAFQGGSMAPLQDQLQQSFAEASASETTAQKALVEAQNAATQAAAQSSRAGNDVYASSGANAAQRTAAQNLASAQGDLTAAQTQKAAILDKLRGAQSDAASNAPGAVWNPRIQQFLDDPVFKAGLSKGLQIQRLESLAAGKPFNSTEFAVTGMDESGNPVVGNVPNMRLLDAGKKGLDSIIQDNRDGVTGRLNQYGRAVDQVRRSYLGELDRINPDYAAARASWSGPSASLDAINAGGRFLSKSPAEVTDDIGNLAAGDKEFYKLGAADTLVNNAESTGRTGNPTSRIAQSVRAQQQLRPLFDNDTDFDNFITGVNRANQTDGN